MSHPLRTLLLTATIAPPATTTRLARADPALRRADYERAMAWYSSHLLPSDWVITLVENSGSDLTSLVEIAARNGHDLQIVESDSGTAGRQGKGNGEARMLDDAIRAVRERVDDNDHQIVKATGRLIAKNLVQVVPMRSGPHVAARMHRDRTMADTRVLAADTGTWQKFLTGLDPLVDEEHGRFLEHAVALRIAQALFETDAVWVPFQRELWVAGTSGTDGIRYDTPRARATRVVKDLLGRLPQGEYR